jgi:hypothetical protein
MRKTITHVVAALAIAMSLAACHQTELGQAVGFPKPDKPQQFQDGR